MKLIAFDLDGTILENWGSWTAIHEHFGVETDERNSLNDYTAGKIDIQELMNRNINSWIKKAGKLHIDQVKNILVKNLKIRPEAYNVIENLRKNGFHVAIISSGIDIIAEEVARRLSIPYVISNGLETDENGYLTGKGIHRVDLFNKDEILINLANQLNIDLSNVVAVGDSAWDKNFLNAAGTGIMIGDDTELSKVAKHKIHNLNEILEIVQ